MRASSFIAQSQTSKVSEPRHGSFDDVSHHAKSAAIFRARPCEHRSDAALDAFRDIGRCAVSPITQGHLRFEARTTSSTSYGRHCVEQVHRLRAVVHIGRCCLDDERCAMGLAQDVAFAAFFCPIRGIRPRVAPPKSARKLALSITETEASSWPRRPKVSRSFSWRLGQMPSFVQSRSRRQQVTPLPQPSSNGMNRHGRPVLSRKMIPLRHCRSVTRGRPPSGLGFSGGNSGSTWFHNSSVRSMNAIASPPCYLWHSCHRQTLGF